MLNLVADDGMSSPVRSHLEFVRKIVELFEEASKEAREKGLIDKFKRGEISEDELLREFLKILEGKIKEVE